MAHGAAGAPTVAAHGARAARSRGHSASEGGVASVGGRTWRRGRRGEGAAAVLLRCVVSLRPRALAPRKRRRRALPAVEAMTSGWGEGRCGGGPACWPAPESAAPCHASSSAWDDGPENPRAEPGVSSPRRCLWPPPSDSRPKHSLRCGCVFLALFSAHCRPQSPVSLSWVSQASAARSQQGQGQARQDRRSQGPCGEEGQTCSGSLARVCSCKVQGPLRPAGSELRRGGSVLQATQGHEGVWDQE